jgi:flavin reductase (DIM6/NTAB) family NADH-FMN oxidoreductase RutF
MRRTIEPHDALRLLNGGPVALLTTRFRNETNVMPAIWTVSLSRRPPLIGVAVNQARYTHDMVRFAEEFALSFPGRDLLNHTHYFGAVSGADVGKLELAKLPTFKASKVSAPLIDHCLAYVECSLQAEEEAFDETWRLEDREYRPLHYLGLDRYAVLGQRLQAELRTTDEGAIELAESQDERERREEEEALEAERRKREGDGSD